MNADLVAIDMPFVSIIVPVLNGERDIRDCLTGLLQQNYPAEQYEVVVVDNGSTDHTVTIVNSFESVLLLSNSVPGAAASRNKGAKAAKGEILLFVDSDCIAHEGLLFEHVQTYLRKVEEFSVDAVGGAITGIVSNFWSLCDDYCSWAPNNPGLDEGVIQQYWPSANFSMKTNVFQRLGGFDERLLRAEDVEICMRLRLSGGTIFFQPKAIVQHKNRTTGRAVLKRAWNWAKVDKQQVKLGVVHNSPYPIFIQAFACLFIFFYTPLILSLKVKRYSVVFSHHS
jgi:Predicted glycosyltransferases